MNPYLETPWEQADKLEIGLPPLKGYYYQYAVYKDYAGYRRKLVMLKGVHITTYRQRRFTPKYQVVNEEKLQHNIIRAKNKILEYGLCNSWQYFITLTISPEKHDRTDLNEYRKKLTQYIRDLRKFKGWDIKYLLIPEKHKDGVSWHMHGFINGLPAEALKQNENGYLDWPGYAERFGYCSLSPLRDKKRAVSYITKYVTKELAFAVTKRNAQLYYASRGLRKAEVLHAGGFIDTEQCPGDYENDWARVRWYDEDFPDLSKNFFQSEKSVDKKCVCMVEFGQAPRQGKSSKVLQQSWASMDLPRLGRKIKEAVDNGFDFGCG